MPYKDPEKKREHDREYQREYRANPKIKEKKRERDREYRANPEYKKKKREYMDIRKYGISRAEMVELLGSDDCGICGFNGGAKLNAIDHCKETSLPRSITVRGFLCHPCNVAIGLFNHQTDRLQKAIRYLENPPLIHPEQYQRMLKIARAKSKL